MPKGWPASTADEKGQSMRKLNPAYQAEPGYADFEKKVMPINTSTPGVAG